MSEYKYCNHHHVLSADHELVDFGDGEFVANKKAIPLLRALNEAGLKTRTHHYASKDNEAFVSILLDNVRLEIKDVFERDATRTKYNGKKELLIQWESKENLGKKFQANLPITQCEVGHQE